MEQLSFFEALKEMHVTEFSFTLGTKKLTQPKEADEAKGIPAKPASFYVTLILDEPIEVVTGSLKLYDPEEQKWLPVTEVDVDEIKVYADDIEKYSKDFKYDKITKKGHYAGDMVLDVESRGEGVWLTDETFAQFKSKKYKDADKARLQRVKEKIRGLRK